MIREKRDQGFWSKGSVPDNEMREGYENQINDLQQEKLRIGRDLTDNLGQLAIYKE